MILTIAFSLQIPCLINFHFLSYLTTCFQLIRLQDSKNYNISKIHWDIKLNFCMWVEINWILSGRDDHTQITLKWYWVEYSESKIWCGFLYTIVNRMVYEITVVWQFLTLFFEQLNLFLEANYQLLLIFSFTSYFKFYIWQNWSFWLFAQDALQRPDCQIPESPIT